MEDVVQRGIREDLLLFWGEILDVASPCLLSCIRPNDTIYIESRISSTCYSTSVHGDRNFQVTGLFSYFQGG